MSRQRKKKPSERKSPSGLAGPQRPAGIQSMNRELYQSVQQAIREMAALRSGAEG